MARCPPSPHLAATRVEGSPLDLVVECRMQNTTRIMSTPSDMKDAMDQIREIVVGAIQRELEKRISRAETHFAARTNEMQQDGRRRTEVIESHLQKESDALSARVEAEAVDTKEALRALGRDHREMTSALEQRVAKLEELMARQQQALRQQILEQAKTFLDQLQALRAELTETLERELATLDTELGGEEQPRDRRSPESADQRTSP
jgi:phage host-nuclease inhibitor protein Gam